jgi:ferredoxin
MRGAIVYFSGTGNTEFVAKLFKNKFSEKGIDCGLFEISKKKSLSSDYDFYVFGSPIYAEVFPDYFMDWVKDKVQDGHGKKCIIFSTQAAETGSGADELAKILKKKGFEVAIQDSITMPNNYYVVAFRKPTNEEAEILKQKAKERVDELVEKFLAGEKVIRKVSNLRRIFGKLSYKAFYKLTSNWAQKRLSVNYDLCVKCGKCAKNCPTGNIAMRDEITFANKCISCQKCIHKCPVNAFLYKGKPIEQYKI